MDRSPTRTRIRQSVGLAAAAAMTTLFAASPVAAVPPLPSPFYGTVTDATTGGPAPVGLPVRAEILDAEVGATVVGSTVTYSHLTLTVYSLEAIGDDTDTTGKEGGLPGESMAIIVGDADIGETSQATTWQGGSNVRLDLVWTPALSQPPAPEDDGGVPPGGGGGATTVLPPPLPTVTIMGLPVEGIAGDGLTRFDGGRVILEFPAGVTATLADGSPVATVAVDETTQAPALPEDLFAVGAILDAAPAGATFSPPLTLTIGYSEAGIPDESDPATLRILHHDGAEWLTLDSTVDTVARQVTAAVDRFSRFALAVARPATTAPPATEPPSEPTTAPAEPDAALEPETTTPAEAVTEPEPEGEPEPQVEPGPAAPLLEPEPPEVPAGPTNWWLVGGLAFAIIVGLFLLYRVGRQLWGGRYD
ncbi:MAG: hypothetical protein V3S10_00785 [Dehalococcoidales bacterium]